MIKNIIFSGGSIKGINYIGTIKYLEELNIIDKLENFAGTSIGSLFCFFLILGYTSKDLSEIFLNINIDKFRDIKSDDILNFFEIYGFDSGDKISKTLKLLLKKKLECDDITFIDLYNKTKKNLIVVGSCLNTMSPEYFSKSNYPNMSVLLAIRISFSIPVIYKPIIFNNKYYVDGALTDNYAIHLFENNNKKTIGFVITSKDIFESEIKDIENYLLSVMFTSFNNQLKNKIDKYKDISIEIESNINSLDYSLSKEDKLDLINNGYNSTKKKILSKFSFLINK